MFWPRTNYRRDVSSGVVLFVWCSVLVCRFDEYWSFVLVLTLGVIYYTIILLYYIIHILYLIIYYILYYTLPLFSSILPLLSSFSSPILFLWSSLPIILFFLSFPPSQSSSSPSPHSLLIFLFLPIFLPIFILYLSVLGYTYLYLIFQLSRTILTPHVLSEWMSRVV